MDTHMNTHKPPQTQNTNMPKHPAHMKHTHAHNSTHYSRSHTRSHNWMSKHGTHTEIHHSYTKYKLAYSYSLLAQINEQTKTHTHTHKHTHKHTQTHTHTTHTHTHTHTHKQPSGRKFHFISRTGKEQAGESIHSISSCPEGDRCSTAAKCRSNSIPPQLTHTHRHTQTHTQDGRWALLLLLFWKCDHKTAAWAE